MDVSLLRDKRVQSSILENYLEFLGKLFLAYYSTCAKFMRAKHAGRPINILIKYNWVLYTAQSHVHV
jgi:hypothetical protein